MLNSTIVLADSTSTNRTFVMNKLDGSGSERIDTSTSLAQPRILSIRHNTTGKGSDTVDRHLISLSLQEADVNGTLRTVIVNTTVTVPRAVSISRAEIDDLLAFTKNFLAVPANVDAILRNES